MPRNGSGTASIPNSFSSGTAIASASVNANFTDIASELTNSLPRDGQAGMTGQLKAANGTAAAPGIAFDSDTNTGLYRKSGDTIGIVAGGTEVGTIDTEGLKDSVSRVIVGLPTGLGPLPWSSTTAPAGWVRCNGRTIGNASSGGTERANADTEDLFAHLWDNFSNSVCAVSSGRGASAAADYAANKTIALLDIRGRSIFGTDDMGNSAASRLGAVLTTPTTIGSSGGTETHTLTTAQLAVTTPTGSVSAPTISVQNGTNVTQSTANVTGGTTGSAIATIDANTVSRVTVTATSSQPTFTGNSFGSGQAHPNLPPAIVLPMIMKL